MWPSESYFFFIILEFVFGTRYFSFSSTLSCHKCQGLNINVIRVVILFRINTDNCNSGDYVLAIGLSLVKIKSMYYCFTITTHITNLMLLVFHQCDCILLGDMLCWLLSMETRDFYVLYPSTVRSWKTATNFRQCFRWFLSNKIIEFWCKLYSSLFPIGQLAIWQYWLKLCVLQLYEM